MNVNPVLEKISEHAIKQADVIAIYHRDGNYTFSQLDALIHLYAQKLARTVLSAPMIAIHLSRTPHMVALILACWKLGKAYVPLDPKHPLTRKQNMLNHCKPSLIVCDSALDCALFSDYSSLSLNKLMALEAHDFESFDSVNEMAYILYTSGSTGEPKGISIAHGGVLALMQWAEKCYTPQQLSCVLASTTVTFDLSIFELFAPLYCGTSLCLIDSIFSLLNIESVSLPPISLINTVPSAMRELTRLAVIPPSVNTINLAGEALTWDLVEALYQFPYIDAVYNLWGPSEDTTYSSWFLCPREKTTPCNVPIGYAVDGGEVFILDKDLKELVQGEEGEICLAGQGLALGYYLNDELTQQKFIKRADGKQIYKTGDLGFIDAAGIVHFKGRIDLQVKVNGFRIELEEIENNLNSLPEVLEAVVTVISHQNHQQLLAGVRVQSTAEKAQLIALLREKLSIHLPEYMLPQRWYVTEEFLPRTPNGKLCRKKVVLLAADTANEIQFAEDSFAELVFNSLGLSC